MMASQAKAAIGTANWAGPVALAMVAATWLAQTEPAKGTAAPPSAARKWDFESDKAGETPAGFIPAKGEWKVAAAGANKVLAQRASNPDDVFNVVLIDGTSYRDVDLSVRLKAVEGEIDQGGGLVWRAKDAQNYYLARYNPLEDNYRVYKVVDGKRTMFKSVKLPGDTEWHTLRVTMSGPKIECYVDGKSSLAVEDATFPGAGRIGLWSKADARSYFDDLTARP